MDEAGPYKNSIGKFEYREDKWKQMEEQLQFLKKQYEKVGQTICRCRATEVGWQNTNQKIKVRNLEVESKEFWVKDG